MWESRGAPLISIINRDCFSLPQEARIPMFLVTQDRERVATENIVRVIQTRARPWTPLELAEG